MKLIIIFIIFGFLFGLLNKADFTVGDKSYSMMHNIPALYTQEVVGEIFSRVEEARTQRLRETLEIGNQELYVQNDESEGLSYNEKRERFASQMIIEKNLLKNDAIIGEKGALRFFKGMLSFPILSAFTWGLIGFVIYIILVVKKKVSNVNAG